MTSTLIPTTDKSFAERVFHAIAYEVIAVLICAPFFAWVMNQPLLQMGALNMAISVIAITWNMVVTRTQDHLLVSRGIAKTVWVRIAHAIVFEGGLTVAAVTLAVWWLGITYWRAFLLDAALLVFFLPYTVVYNWLYDILRMRIVQRARANAAGRG